MARDLEAANAENAELKARLDEAEQTLRALRQGEVDAIVVGDSVYTLESAGAASSRFRGEVFAQMSEAVVATDVQGLVTNLNPAAERLYGRRASFVLGRPPHELYTTVWRSAADAAGAAAAAQAGLAWRGVVVHRRADGRALCVEAALSPLRDAHGAPAGQLAVMRDVTELARREREFSTLVENSPDIVARLTPELRHSYVSPAVEKYTGLAPALFIGKTNRELGMPESLCERWDAALRDVLRRREVGRVEFDFERADTRQCFHFESRLIPEFDSSGSVESVLSVTVDVSERVRAARSLQQADRRKTEFLATMSHELRNPLAPITASLYLLRKAATTAQREASLQVIERQVKHLVHLVDELMDVNRITHDKLTLRTQPLDVAEALHGALETAQPLIDSRNHTLIVDLAATPLRVQGDPTRLTQVFANIVGNAAKYTPDGGCIALRAAAEGGDVVVSVRDNGVGIAPEALPTIFEMFTQVGDDASGRHGGLGIGLALVQRLVRLHGGSVQAHSEGVGAGVEVIVRLPLLAPSSTPSDAALAPSAAPASPRGLRVLIADDNEDIVSSLAAIVAAMGCETATARDGLEAVAMARSFNPDVALLDIGMPGLDGNAVARLVRDERDARLVRDERDARGGELTLIALSGWGQADDRRRTAAAGFDHHLVKPIDLSVLEGLIRKRGGNAQS